MCVRGTKLHDALAADGGSPPCGRGHPEDLLEPAAQVTLVGEATLVGHA